MFKFELGTEAVDLVTGFTGIIVGRADYLTGCNQYALQPEMKKDVWSDSKWFDEHRLRQGSGKQVKLPSSEKPGCDITPPRI